MTAELQPEDIQSRLVVVKGTPRAGVVAVDAI